MMFKRHPLLVALLALSLSSGFVAHEASSPALAKKADKSTSTSSDSKTSPDKIRKRPEASKVVLSAETKKAIQDVTNKLDPQTRESFNKLSESIRQEDRAIYNELRDDEETSVSDIGMLWEAAVERSGTIRYAIEKLSRRDATGKPVENDGFSKRMVQSLVHLGGVAGSMWTGSPTGVLGASMVNDLMRGNPQDDPALSRVTDADMVILAKEVETLQAKLIQKYYAYRHAKECLALAEEANATIGKYFDHAGTLKDESAETIQTLMQSFYDSSRQDVGNAQQAYASAKTDLSSLVGPDAIAALDQGGKDKTSATASQ
jgi:gas vesicle protein